MSLLDRYLEESENSNDLTEMFTKSYTKLQDSIKAAAESLRLLEKAGAKVTSKTTTPAKNKLFTDFKNLHNISDNDKKDYSIIINGLIRQYNKDHPVEKSNRPSSNELINNARKTTNAAIDNMNKTLANNKDKYMRCSVNAKLNIYDSYESGLLTESEKNELLSYFESDVKDDYEKHIDSQLNDKGDINRKVDKKNNKCIEIKPDPNEYNIPDESNE